MKKMKLILSILIVLLLASCSSEKIMVDLVVYNAKIYSVDSAFTIYQAMAIKDGKVFALGTDEEVKKTFSSKETTDASGKSIFPGLIDAHCHFVGYGLGLRQVNLVGTSSFSEIISRVISFSQKNKPSLDDTSPTALKNETSDTSWIIGRGWDQNDWKTKQYPTKHELDSLFPDRPVMLTRIDGHAALVNSAALKRSHIDHETRVEGGEILKTGNNLSGILIDRAVDLVNSIIPAATNDQLETALLTAQDNCLAVGLTTVDDAGLMKSDIDAIDKLQKAGKLKIRVYAMISDSAPNYVHYLKTGPYKSDRLNVRSFKFYADGALGSRGACLFDDYSDQTNWKGFLLTPIAHLEKYAEILDKAGFQMNTHCIGDSALNRVMNIYLKYCNEKKEHRWRIEHAQITGSEDFKNFSEDLIPSVQPTHATSDMYWAQTRLGKERIKNAYAYKELLTAAGIIALGTDFPVEDISPFKTFFAAVARQDNKGFPAGGFQPENALSREQTIRGLTIWAAYSNFEEKEKGSLEKGKMADFIILDNDMMTCDIKKVLDIKVLSTYINGEKVYSIKR